jgi:hypothetical protein
MIGRTLYNWFVLLFSPGTSDPMASGSPQQANSLLATWYLCVCTHRQWKNTGICHSHRAGNYRGSVLTWQQPTQFLLLSGFGECSVFFFLYIMWGLIQYHILVGKKRGMQCCLDKFMDAKSFHLISFLKSHKNPIRIVFTFSDFKSSFYFWILCRNFWSSVFFF